MSDPEWVRQLSILLTLDVRNAFNTAGWTEILQAVETRRFSPYIVRMIMSYLSNRRVLVGEGEEMEEIQTTSGVPQGSVMGPTLWNILYDEVLNLDLPDEIKLVGFADDLAVVIVAKTVEELNVSINVAISRICDWMQTKRLELAPEKTEAVLLTGKRKVEGVTVSVLETQIDLASSVRYLGIQLDKHLKFGEHVGRVTTKADNAIANLMRLMPNIGGPRASKRRALCGAAQSIILYGAPIWSKALEIQRYKNMVDRVTRKAALRISSAYRTVSTEAVMVIAGVIPCYLSAAERRKVREDGIAEESRRREARIDTINKWQEEWGNGRKGAWTRHLIPDLRVWVGRKFGEVNHHTTQVLTGHGCFKSYLFGIGKATSEECSYCGEEDTADHTAFHCRRWTIERDALYDRLGTRLEAENIVTEMLKNENNWNLVEAYLTMVMALKIEDERQEQRHFNPA